MANTMPTETTTPTRGDYVQTCAGPARYVGLRNRVQWLAYEGDDFDALCRGFDESEVPS